MRKTLLVLLASASLALCADEIRGVWKGTAAMQRPPQAAGQPGAPGGPGGPGGGPPPMEVTLSLQMKDNKLVGSITNRAGEQPIEEGTFDGKNFSFVISSDVAPNYTKQVYKGSLEGGTLKMELPFRRPGNAPPVEVSLNRISTDPAPLLPPRATRPTPVTPLPDNKLARTPPMGWNSWNHF